MRPLALITAMGGMNPGGRTSGHQSYLRQVYDALPASAQAEVLQELRVLSMAPHAEHKTEQELLAGTLMRTIEPRRFDIYKSATMVKPKALEQPLRVKLRDRDQHWHTTPHAEQVRLLVQSAFPVRHAGQIPRGFAPGTLYASRNHPLALELSVFGMSDALAQSGLNWERDILGTVPHERILVMSGSAIGQNDANGLGGYLNQRALGQRIGAQNLAFGLPEMSADFINAYVLGSLGQTGHNAGACATFLYNLRSCAQAIEAGDVDVAVVGAADAHVLEATMEAFYVMRAMPDDDKLLQMQARTGQDARTPNHRHACRPFGDNCGMAMGESAQFCILMSDRLALAKGAQILGSVGGVFVHADGAKTSISKPGPGNYLTVARACARALALCGDAGKERTVMFTHGTATPQNRVSESHVLSTVAHGMGFAALPTMAPKGVLGHSMAAAAGDALMAGLGIAAHGILPGIESTPYLADDVHTAGLDFILDHRATDPERWQCLLINAKGFGGNNATGAVLTAGATQDLLRQRHGARAMTAWQHRHDPVAAAARAYEREAHQGHYRVRYNSTRPELTEDDVRLRDGHLKIDAYQIDIDLHEPHPFGA